MFIAYAVVAGLLALTLAASATFTLQRNPAITESMGKVGVPDSWLPRLATLKAAGAIGLVAGLWLTPLGIAAAIGVTLYFLGAILTHVRAKDYDFAPAAVLALVAVAALVLRAAA
ncbi:MULTISPECIES: DoxX family protein [unclassified Streptomyces]|uniref:DoxX family protein n=1 Tax=unclassified Streptomyces TaxID=2593676 RepID=UPI0020304D41|nr:MULTISPECIES: DoxX family protein [unclassified Streptomyces]MCM1976978.1 DoxX family protein [Streptomyces sp. G1]MCX5125670.1 DoxX family protein [Streptomyces sp. NBC_00347]